MIAPENLPLLETQPEPRTRGVGTLEARRGEGKAVFPLAGVDIRARVADRVAQVTVIETFHNPFEEPLEAVYIFPLPGGCAVSRFDLTVGGRVVRGVVRERARARLDYEQALHEGKRAGLMEQERDDLFTVQVGNIPPGEVVIVTIELSEELPFFEDGSTELRLPLVVAPRYIPGVPLADGQAGTGVELDTDQVPDASRITPPRLVPGFDPGVALKLSVELLDGSVSELASSQHATGTAFEDGRITVCLASGNELMDRDFILRWRLAGGSARSELLVHRDAGGAACGLISVLRPATGAQDLIPRDVIFVLDRSGSMEGPKMASAARACSILLGTLGPRDRFGILAFDTVNEWFEAEGGGRIVPANPGHLAEGNLYLRRIDARGGTAIEPATVEALAALSASGAPAQRTRVLVLITDGQIGNEGALFKQVQKARGNVRIFTVGIDTAVNEGFLKRLAQVGGGTCTCVTPGDALESALQAIGREIGQPAVTGLKVIGESGRLDAVSTAPARLPDLFEGRGASIFVRLETVGSVRISGRAPDGSPHEELLEPREVDLPALVHLWARARVRDLEDQFRVEPERQLEIRKEIVDLAVQRTLLTRFTAFLAVDEAELVNPDGTLRTVTQPVAMPAEWEMEERERGISPMMACLAGAGAPADRSVMTSAAMRSLPPGLARFLARPGIPKSPSPHLGKPAMSREQKAAAEPLRPLLERLGQALSQARTDMEAGRLPAADEIEHARDELVAHLARTHLETDLPRLARLLISDLLQLLLALKQPGAMPAGAQPLLEATIAAFKDAWSELGQRLGGEKRPPVSLRAFWQSGI